MALAYLTDPNLQFVTRSGVPNVGGFVRVFYNGTDDDAITYRNWEGALNQKRIELDSNGRAVIIAEGSIPYRIEVYARDGMLLWTAENVFSQIGLHSIGRNMLSNVHNLVPDSRYLQFKDFGGNVVVSLCDALQTWLATEGYTP